MKSWYGLKQKLLICCCVFFLILMVLGSLPGTAMAWRYSPGSLGVASSISPPPGFHYIMYNCFYSANTLNDDNGNALNVGLDLNVFASAHQFVYITKYKILGGFFGIDTTIPLIQTDLQIDALGVDSDDFGLGDVCLEPFCLTWHYPRFNFILGLALYVPTGDDKKPSSPGLGYYSLMETLGLNIYLDEKKTWTASILSRWLQNLDDDDTGVTSGAEIVAEYGIGKTFMPSTKLFFRAGLAGYSALQISKDHGNGADPNVRRKVHALGPDLNLTRLGPLPLQLEMRYMWEYGSEGYTQGRLLTVTLRASF